MMWPSWAAVNNKFNAIGCGSSTKMSFSWPVKVFKSVPRCESQIFRVQSDTAVMASASSRDHDTIVTPLIRDLQNEGIFSSEFDSTI